METTLTKRVGSGVSEGTTKRITAAPSAGTTRRVTNAITESTTVRIEVDVPLLNASLLLLEGDFGGGLAFTNTDEAAGFFGYLTLEGSY